MWGINEVAPRYGHANVNRVRRFGHDVTSIVEKGFKGLKRACEAKRKKKKESKAGDGDGC